MEKWGNEVKRWSTDVPGKEIFELVIVFFMQNIDESHCIYAVIFMEQKRIQYYDQIGSDGNEYTTDLMRYPNYNWAAKKGGELPNADKWKIVGAVDGVPQKQNGFDCGDFSCMFA